MYQNITFTDSTSPSVGVFDKVRLKPTCSAIETSLDIKILGVASRNVKPENEKQRCFMDCADGQAGLRLCFSYTIVRFSFLEAHKVSCKI